MEARVSPKVNLPNLKTAGDRKKRDHGSKNLKKHKKTKGRGNPRKKSKSSKGRGFCCARKKKSPSKKHRKVTTKQPKKKDTKPLAPAPDEKLGNIELVKTPVQRPGGSLKKSGNERKTSTENDKNEAEGKPMAKSDNEKKSAEKKSMEDDKKVTEKTNEKENEKDVKLLTAKSEGKEKDEVIVIPKKPKETDAKEDVPAELNEKYEKFLSIAKKIAAEDATIPAKEFENISLYIPPFVSKNQFVENMDKNRFSDVICMDHSRVSLSDDSYIHANWVEIDKKRRAILTQLPLPHTACDFWQMVIDQQIKVVLLILTETEFDDLGGNFVFPQNQDFLNFEERGIRIGEFKDVEIMKGWNMKVLSVNNGTYKSFIHVNHFKLWAHDDIPKNLKHVWQLQSVLRKYQGPHVYMSLSGCGRAGTYAFFEKAHSYLHSDEAQFEMDKCLQKLRNGRMHSVQNITQYSFVYSLIAEHILGNGFSKIVKCGEDDDGMQKVLRQLTIQ